MIGRTARPMLPKDDSRQGRCLVDLMHRYRQRDLLDPFRDSCWKCIS